MITPPPLLGPADRRVARKTLRAWQRAAGPWAPYVWPTLLTAPRSFQPHDWQQDEARASALVEEFCVAVAGDHGPAGDAWRARKTFAIADLPATVALSCGPRLARRGVRPVAVLRRWPHPLGLLPVSHLVEAYHRYARQLVLRGQPRGAMWLVESERALPLPASPWEPAASLRARLDNRYTLDTQDLPSAAQLRAAGHQTVLVITNAANPVVAGDLAGFCRDIAAQGLSVVVLPLAADGPPVTAVAASLGGTL